MPRPDTGYPTPAASPCGAIEGATATARFAPDGATPDDATDDLPPIQAAIDAASAAGGGIVSLPAGTFLLDRHLLVKSGVKLMGAGPTTVLKAGPRFLATRGPKGGVPLITTLGAENVTIANLTADHSGDTLNGDVEDRLVAFFVDVRESRNAVVDGVSTRNPFSYSIAIVETQRFCVARSNTRVQTKGRYNQLDGIHILDSAHGLVVENEIDQRFDGSTDGDDGLVAHTMKAAVFDVVYARNKVRGGHRGNGMQLAVGNFPIHDLTIENNELHGSPFGIRTGYYEEGRGIVHDLVIRNNVIRDLRPGFAFPDGGDAIAIYEAEAEGVDSGSRPFGIQVTKNRACNAGTITLLPGPGNVVSDNSGC